MLEIPRLNLLFSYAMLRKTGAFSTQPDKAVAIIGDGADVLIDSGAFSNHTSRVKAAVKGTTYDPITVEDYTAFCKRIDGAVFQYVALDVIADPQATRDNLAYMLAEGVCPMPVFVEGEDWSEIPRLVALNGGWLCVGGGVVAADEYIHARYRRVYEVSKGQAKIHALGFVRWPDIFQLPIASGDSSSYTAGSRWGMFTVYDPTEGLTTLTRPKLWHGEGSPRVRERIIGECARAGLSRADLLNKQLYVGNRGVAALITAMAYLGLHTHASSLGLKFFFAVSNLGWIIPIVAALRARTENGYQYRHALAEHERLETLLRTDKLAFCRELAQVFKEETCASPSTSTIPWW